MWPFQYNWLVWQKIHFQPKGMEEVEKPQEGCMSRERESASEEQRRNLGFLLCVCVCVFNMSTLNSFLVLIHWGERKAWEAYLLGLAHVTSMAVWLRTFAVRLAPLSGRPANVVTVAGGLGVKPTLLCTKTLYSYVVNLKGCFLKGHYKFLFYSKQNTQFSFSSQNTGFPSKCTIFCFP